MMVEFVRTEMANFSSKAVKGVPYAAEGVNESTQTLADGNKITRKNSSSVYRDSQGRTRNEHSLGDVGPWASKGEKMVSIFDPVAKVNITLHPDKSATKLQMPGRDGGEAAWVTSSGDGNNMVFERRVEGPKLMIRGAETTAGATREPRVQQDIVIERSPEAGASVTVAGVAGGLGMASTAAVYLDGGGEGSQKRSFNRESLGKKVIEGVEAEGTRSVMTIAAGEIGNDRPIEVVDETWYSKELEALVYSRHADPRTGETTYRLTNIRRGEQPIDLFEIPSDYKVQEGFKVMKDKLEMKLRAKKPE